GVAADRQPCLDDEVAGEPAEVAAAQPRRGAQHERHHDGAGHGLGGPAAGDEVEVAGHAHPEICTCWSGPHRARVSRMSRTVRVTMLVRIAMPVARPTPSGPPLAVKPW